MREVQIAVDRIELPSQAYGACVLTFRLHYFFIGGLRMFKVK